MESSWSGNITYVKDGKAARAVVDIRTKSLVAIYSNLSHSIGTVQITFKPAESGTITIIGISVIPEIPVAALVFVTIAGMSSAIIIGRKYSSLP